jgi:adenosylcobyric acid synthase
MVLGTGSHVGKSLVAAGLCRILSDRGWDVAPYKAQNMALNSAVADDGSEIGRAQWLQAVAARVRSEARMNPVLLKPVGGRGSQLVVLGQARGVHSTRAYFRLWPGVAARAQAAWRGLAADHEALVLEGAGSPAEVNLSHRDLANLETARFSGAPFILVADIERGGAFASLTGTLDLLPAWLRGRCQGVVLNKFRGDSSLLDSGLDWLRRRGIRPLGVLPWMGGLCLEEEDSLALPRSPSPGRPGKGLVVDVVRHRCMANFNDFLPLQGLPGLHLRWVDPGQARGAPDLLILPGSKDSLADLRRLRASGELARMEAWRRQGTWVLGICGGLQMLGHSILDPAGVDGGRKGAREQGLGWLSLGTRMAARKVLAHRQGRTRVSLGRQPLSGYEIHHGRSRTGPDLRVEGSTRQGQALLYSGGSGRVWGTYLHGILDGVEFRDAFLSRLAKDRGKAWRGAGPSLNERREASLRAWARHMERHLDLGFLPARRRGA